MKVRLGEILDEELPNCKQVALTLDHWTSRSNDAYQATTLHYINDKFKLRRWVLGVSPFSIRHTGKNIAEYLDKVIECNEALNSVQRRVAVVDQAYNMKTALSLSLKVESLNEGSIQCADHKLNTILSNSIEKADVLKSAIDAGTKVTTRIHHSPLAQLQLLAGCEANHCELVKA